MAATLVDTAEITCCLIPDGHHVHPVFVRQALKCVGVRRCVLVTDSVAATGMPDGDYLLGTTPVSLADGQVRTRDGTLAGAAITMHAAGRRFLEMVPDASAWTLAQVAATNPARCIGAKDWGVIEPGRRAVFTLLADDGSCTTVRL